MRSRLLAYRRTAAIAAVWAAAMAGLVLTSPSASGQEAVEPGRANAYAQGIKVNPRTGGLSFGITYGMALAGHQNNSAVGESRSADLGVIGTTLAGAGCDGGDPTLPREDQPQPLVVRSSDEEAAREESENGVEKKAQATDAPFAEAVAITAATGDPAAVQIGGSTSRTASGIIDGARRATAVTEVSDITFAAGAFVIKGLRWEVVHQTAPTEAVTGSFTIEGIEAAGVPIPTDDVVGALAELNELLAPLGISINAPEVRDEAGIISVEPMSIGIVPSETRDGVLGSVLSGLSPVRESVIDALIGIDCGNASYITIADIVLGSITGAGSLSIELGGVNATSSEIQGTSLLGGLPSLGSLSPAVPASPAGGRSLGSSGGGGSSGAFGGGGGGTTSGVSDTATTDETSPGASADDETALPDVQPLSGSRGGPLIGVGLGGLLLLAALAEGDRRKMRAAQRSVPMEVMA